jgi:hypothetical protein
MGKFGIEGKGPQSSHGQIDNQLRATAFISAGLLMGVSPIYARYWCLRLTALSIFLDSGGNIALNFSLVIESDH